MAITNAIKIAQSLAAIDQAGAATPAGKAELVELARRGLTGPEMLARLDAAVAGTLQRTTEDLELLLAHAEMSWSADQRNPTATRTRDSARRLVEMVPDLADGYRLLGFAHLTRREYREAFLALSAVKTIALPADAGTQTDARLPRARVNYDNFRALARSLMSGSQRCTFELGGHRYSFDLSTHNAAAVEASAFHAVGMLTEWEELQFLGAILSPERTRRIVEVGVLMGNHTAYFLKTLRPAHITLIDGDPANIPFIEHTVFYNLPEPRPQVDVQCAFIAGSSGEATFAGARMPRRILGELVRGGVDFIKIDVDGGEVNLLKGAAEVIEGSRPVVMIETTPNTHEPVVGWFAARKYGVKRVFDHGAYRNVVLLPA